MSSPSCLLIDVVTILNTVSNVNKVFAKMLMETFATGLQNDMIKPFEIGWLVSSADSVTHQVLIIDTTLWSFITPQVRKMTTKLNQICGCELFIIPNYMHIDLNIIITMIVTYFKQKFIERHTCKRLFFTTSDTNYKHQLFPGCEYLHATIRYAYQCMTCIHIKP